MNTEKEQTSNGVPDHLEGINNLVGEARMQAGCLLALLSLPPKLLAELGSAGLERIQQLINSLQ